MQRNRTRSDLKQDILSTLGHPIVKVNLTNDHLDNVINAALKKFWRWHGDGSIRTQYMYTMTQEDVDRGWFLVPEYIDAVVEVIPPTNYFGTGNFATAEWQLTAQTVMSANRFLPLNLSDYVAASQRIFNTQQVMGKNIKLFEFARLQHRVIFFFKAVAGDTIALRVFENVDPERTDPNAVQADLVFDNETLKDLCVAYAQQQWGMILTRFSGMTLPGGVQIDGNALIQQGKDNETEVIDRLKSETVDLFYSA